VPAAQRRLVVSSVPAGANWRSGACHIELSIDKHVSHGVKRQWSFGM
jgi:hypothetical protein